MILTLQLYTCIFAITGALLLHDWNGMAIDKSGHLYLVDAEGGEIWKISPSGKVEPFIGLDKGIRLNHPHHLSVDGDDNLWLASG
jgi:sugar lactone lactonase YvrE